MRRAIISDIHGNIVAPKAVMQDIGSQGVDDIVCLGDMVGFGPDVCGRRRRCSRIHFLPRRSSLGGRPNCLRKSRERR